MDIPVLQRKVLDKSVIRAILAAVTIGGIAPLMVFSAAAVAAHKIPAPPAPKWHRSLGLALARIPLTAFITLFLIMTAAAKLVVGAACVIAMKTTRPFTEHRAIMTSTGA
tara:strand:- start:1980 stop:2309 length:330 start_codon:yes stop_codon:yes gene_type:complete